jgi:hypothetical protein
MNKAREEVGDRVRDRLRARVRPSRNPAPDLSAGDCRRRMRQAIIMPVITTLPACPARLTGVSPGRRAGSLSGAGPAKMVGCLACRKPLEFYSPQKRR